MSLTITAVAIAAVGTAYSIYNGERTADAQKKAQNEARQNALKQEKASDEAMNAANRKSPDTSAILSAASQSGKGGISSTMLTGPQGIDLSALQLGKNTLLGS